MFVCVCARACARVFEDTGKAQAPCVQLLADFHGDGFVACPKTEVRVYAYTQTHRQTDILMNLEENMRAAAEFNLKHAHRQDRFHHLLPDNNRHENYFLFVNTFLGEHRLKPHLHLHDAGENTK